MPVAHIRVLTGHSREQLKALITEVSSAVARIIGAPMDRLEVWVSEIDPDLWGISGIPASEVLRTAVLEKTEMPFIQMVLMEGRPKEQHHALIRELSEIVSGILGTEQGRIRIHIAETKPDLWGIGGVPASIARAAEIQARAAAASGN